jgi:hypothetical protein
MFVEGFTRQAPYYIHLSDFLIGKPGRAVSGDRGTQRLEPPVQTANFSSPSGHRRRQM